MPSGVHSPLQRSILGVGSTLLILTLLTTILRFLSRPRPSKRTKLRLEDWLILGAQALYIAELSTQFWSVSSSSGIGQHRYGDGDVVGKEEVALALKQGIVLAVLYVWALAFVRLAICVWLKRVLDGFKWSGKFVFLLIGLIIAWGIFSFFFLLGGCRPFSGWWKTDLPGRHCVSSPYPYYIAAACWGIIINAMIWLLPQPVVWRLKTFSPFERIGLSVILLLGICDIIIQLIRLVALIEASKSPDIPYHQRLIQMWSLLEVGILLLVANAPFCRQAFSSLLPSIKCNPGPTLHHADSSMNLVHTTPTRNPSLHPRKSVRTAAAGVKSLEEDQATLFPKSVYGTGSAQAAAVTVRDLGHTSGDGSANGAVGNNLKSVTGSIKARLTTGGGSFRNVRAAAKGPTAGLLDIDGEIGVQREITVTEDRVGTGREWDVV